MKGFLRRNDPSLGVCRGSQQTALRCCGQKPTVLNGQGKGTSMCQVWIMEMNESEPLKKYCDSNPLSKLLSSCG